MGFKKQAIAALSVVSLLAASIGSADFASAEWAENGNWIPAPGVTCAEAQNAINNLQENAASFGAIAHSIRITQDCSANLVIPSGKTVLLSLYSEDENGQRTYHRLTNDGGDTITVEEGASFYYESSDTPEEVISNTTEGKSIINNHGKAHILTGTFRAENGAYTFTNSGELNISGNSFIGTKVQNNGTGKIRVLGGSFDNIEEIRSYVVSNRVIDEANNRVVSIFPEEKSLYEYLQLPALDSEFPVGYSVTSKPEYVDYLEAMEAYVTSSDESVMKVTGSNREGWTVTIVGPGKAELITGMIYGVGSASTYGYLIPSNATDPDESLTRYLVDKFIEVIRQAIENGKTISIDINVRATTGASVEAESAIQKVIGNDTLIDYYDVSLALNGDGEKLTDVHDLEGKDVEVRISATFLNRLEAVKSGYKRNYYVVRYHDGVAEKINAKLDGNDLVFRSGKFSTYAIAYNDTKITSGGGSNSGSHTGTSGSNNGSSNSNTNNTNNSGNSNNASNSGNNTGTNGSSNGLGAPDTGVASYLNNGNATVATACIVVVSAIASGVLAYKAVSKKQRREK